MLLTKHHGLGNDFLVMLDEPGAPKPAVDGALAQKLCERRRGVGADGFIHGAEPDETHAANGIDVVMHLFNADGGRAEMSGNGIRCLGQAFARQRGLTEGRIDVLTDAGRRKLEVSPGPDPLTVDVSVGMGRAGRGPHIPDALDEYFVSRHATVDMGNPHLVVIVHDPAIVKLATEGAWLENQFPNGINVEFASVRPGGDGLDLRVWERGVGVTEACGTGACAAAYLAHSWGLVGDRVEVAMPGGSVTVEIGDDRRVTLIGPSALIAVVDVPDTVPAARTPVEV